MILHQRIASPAVCGCRGVWWRWAQVFVAVQSALGDPVSSSRGQKPELRVQYVWWVRCHFPGLSNNRLLAERPDGRMVFGLYYFRGGLHQTGNQWPQLHCQVITPSRSGWWNSQVRHGKNKSDMSFCAPSLCRKYIRCWSIAQRLSTQKFSDISVDPEVFIWTDLEDKCIISNHSALTAFRWDVNSSVFFTFSSR